MTKKNEESKKTQYLLNTLITILIIFTILILNYVIQSKILKNKNANLFGYTFLRVVTGSMSSTIEIGDTVLVKLTKEVEENDIVVYNENDTLITHRLIQKDGENLITKGDANNTQDDPITINQILGKVVWIFN